MTSNSPTKNSTRRVLIASLAGTTIEFFDFYIYATAAVLVFPKLFFPTSNPTTATLESLATFALAFIARPFGAALFGHFGDKIGRKATLVAALLTRSAYIIKRIKLCKCYSFPAQVVRAKTFWKHFFHLKSMENR